MVCYLDYNATTVMPPAVLETMMKWATRGNPSSTYPSAQEGKKLMDCFRMEIAKHCNFDLIGPNGYTILFTSGGSEANSSIIMSTVRSYKKITHAKPHIITSCVEHDSIRYLLQDLQEEEVDVTEIPLHKYGPYIGTVDLEALAAAIRPNTCLITIMASNNETGIVNDIRAIGQLAKYKSVPFHTDAVQWFQKVRFDPLENNVTAFSVSFHKLFGPTGCGFLAIKNNFLEGYNLKPHIAGSQNGTMRGGTECIHNIAASRTAFKINFEKREEKNARIKTLKDYTIRILSKYIKCVYLDEYRMKKPLCKSIVWLSHPESHVQDGTIFLAVYGCGKDICNVDIRKSLTEKNIYISIGSACKTSDKKASHVLEGIDLPIELKGGVFRISIGDYSEVKDIKLFTSEFIKSIQNCP